MSYEKIHEDQFEENYIVWLAHNVLVVASVNKKAKGFETKEWCAYIDSVENIEGWEKVRKQGYKLPKKVADALFPFSETHRWRG